MCRCHKTHSLGPHAGIFRVWAGHPRAPLCRVGDGGRRTRHPSACAPVMVKGYSLTLPPRHRGRASRGVIVRFRARPPLRGRNARPLCSVSMSHDSPDPSPLPPGLTLCSATSTAMPRRFAATSAPLTRRQRRRKRRPRPSRRRHSAPGLSCCCSRAARSGWPSWRSCRCPKGSSYCW